MIAYGAPAIRALLSGALMLFAVAGATAATADSTASRLIAQASAPVGKGTRAEIQNVQRLLKLLSTRYPEKYASADPKRVDGVFGDDTAIAIKNFQKTSGITTPPRNNEMLVSEILAALARMSALKPKQPQVAAAAVPKVEPKPKPKAAPASVPKVSAPPVPKVTAPPIPRPETKKPPLAATKPDERPVPKVVATPVTRPPAKPPVPEATAPKAKAATPATKTTAAKPDPKPVATTKAAPQKPTTTPKKVARTRPANDRLLYFVQVASLRDSQAARREWRRIRDSNRAALGAENVYFEKANIKGRGIFYRILVGPVRDRETAVVLCSLLKRNGQTCVTTRRNLSAIKDPNAVVPLDPNKPDQRSRLDDDKKLAEGAGVSRPEEKTAKGPTTSESPKAQPSTSGGTPVAQSEKSSPPAKTTPKPEPAPASPTASIPAATEPPKVEPEQAKPVDPATAATETGQKADGRKEEEEDRKVAVTPVPTAPPAPAVKSDPPADTNTKADSTASAPERTPAAVLEKSNATAAIPAPPAASTKSVETSASATTAPARPTVPDAATSTTETTQDTEKPASPAGSRDVAIARPSTASPAPSVTEPSETAATPPLINVNIRLDSWDKVAIPAGVALLVIAGVVVYGNRRRKRKSAFAQIFGTDDLSLDLGSNTAGASETLGALEENFKSDPLRRARRIRDGFLHDVLDGELGEVTPDYSVESAMRINSELKNLLSAKPDDYKSIFLNWMFLSEVGTALHQKDIMIDQLDSDIGRELTLLQNYFKIHLLELDDRHNLRENLPGIFYCLQLPPLRQREAAAISVA